MKTKNTLPISEARKNIFSIAEEVQKSNVYYTLTERGRPKAVVLSAKKFEALIEKKIDAFSQAVFSNVNYALEKESLVRDGARKGYGSEEARLLFKTIFMKDEPTGTYVSGRETDLQRKEDEYIKALLYVELIEKYEYPNTSIELGICVRTNGEERKRYIEVDVVVNDIYKNAEMIFEVASFSDYEKNMERVVGDLFDIASVINWGGKLGWLVYYSRFGENGRVKEKISVIDYSKYKSFGSWKKAGKPVKKEIPQYRR